MKMENSLLAIFDKIPCTIAHGLWPDVYLINLSSTCTVNGACTLYLLYEDSVH